MNYSSPLSLENVDFFGERINYFPFSGGGFMKILLTLWTFDEGLEISFRSLC